LTSKPEWVCNRARARRQAAEWVVGVCRLRHSS
jgi:hypothetical protein